MVRRTLIAGTAVLLAAGFSLTACDGGGGQEDPEDTWTADAPGEDTGAEDTGGDEDTSGGDDDTSMADDTSSGGDDTSGGGDADGGDKCFNCVDEKYKVEKIVNCSEDADEHPERCDVEKPEEYSDWGPGSVISNFELTSEDAKECCFNIDGSEDGSKDNGLATLLSFLPGANIDVEVKQSLVNGEFVVLNEHQGLTSLDQSEEFAVNFFLGEYGSDTASNYVTKVDSDCSFEEGSSCELMTSAGETFLINPESFDDGVQPQAQLTPATISGTDLDAGPGVVVLNLNVAGLGTLGLRINGATIEAQVDKDASDLAGDGVTVTDGKLGGYVLLKDVVGLINNLMNSCDCLDNPTQAITVPSDDASDPDLKPDGCYDDTLPEEDCEITCKEEVEMKTGDCGDNSPGVCPESGTVCSSIGLMTDTADLDVDGDGNKDALSIGAIFELTGAKIDGIADFVKASDQTVGGSNEVAIDRVFANEGGYVAIYEQGQDGAIGNLLGSQWIDAGNTNDVTVTLDSSLGGETDVWAILHKDDGDTDMTFEEDKDSKVKLYEAQTSYVSTGFTLTPE